MDDAEIGDAVRGFIHSVNDRGIVVSIRSLGGYSQRNWNISGILKLINLPPQYATQGSQAGAPDAAPYSNSERLEFLRIHFAKGRKIQCRILDKYPVAEAVTPTLLRKRELLSGKEAATKLLESKKEEFPHQFSLEFDEFLPDNAEITAATELGEGLHQRSTEEDDDEVVEEEEDEGIDGTDDSDSQYDVDEDELGDSTANFFAAAVDPRPTYVKKGPANVVFAKQPPQSQFRQTASADKVDGTTAADNADDELTDEDAIVSALAVDDDDSLPFIPMRASREKTSDADRDMKQSGTYTVGTASGKGVVKDSKIKAGSLSTSSASQGAVHTSTNAQINLSSNEDNPSMQLFERELEKKFHSLKSKLTGRVSVDILKRSEGIHQFIEWGDLQMSDVDEALARAGINTATDTDMDLAQFKAASVLVFDLIASKIQDGSLLNRRSDQEIQADAKQDFRAIVVANQCKKEKKQSEKVCSHSILTRRGSPNVFAGKE
jgi:hypothetical protein